MTSVGSGPQEGPSSAPDDAAAKRRSRSRYDTDELYEADGETGDIVQQHQKRSTSSPKGVMFDLPPANRRTSDDWQSINERKVDDVVLDFLYRPHTITLLGVILLYIIWVGLFSDDSDTALNLWASVKSMFFFLIVISLITFPNGPFTRPHPAVWRLVCGMSVGYLFVLVFALFQKFEDLKAILRWFDPERLHKWNYEEKEYAVNCSDLSWQRVWSHVDVFAFGHFWGWGMKALLLRHSVLLWYLSITWELTEIAFSHILENFKECWWDSIILDVLVCNGLGIWTGMFVCRLFGNQSFHWESVKHIRTTRGKLKRAVLQFTPASFTTMRWIDTSSTMKRLLALAVLVTFWQVTELNTFFLKHIFAIDTDHPITVGRILIIGAISAPTIRQYYEFVTNPRCTRMGTQLWIYVAVVVTEVLICIKFGLPLFENADLYTILIWFIGLMTGTFGVLYCSVWAAHATRTRPIKVNGRVVHRYVESSAENLDRLEDHTELRHRRLAASQGRPSDSDMVMDDDEDED